MADLGNCAYVRADLVPHTAAYPAVICDHVKLKDVSATAVFLSLEALGARGGEPEGEIANDAYFRIRACAELGRNVEGGRVYAHGTAAVVNALLNVFADVVLSELRLKNGLVNVAGQLLDRHICRFFSCFHFFTVHREGCALLSKIGRWGIPSRLCCMIMY